MREFKKVFIEIAEEDFQENKKSLKILEKVFADLYALRTISFDTIQQDTINTISERTVTHLLTKQAQIAPKVLPFLTVNGEVRAFRQTNKVPRRFEKDEYLSLMKRIIALVASIDKLKVVQKKKGEEP